MSESKSDSKSEAKKGSESLSPEPFSINVLCKFINPYEGKRETLTAFLSNCQNALDLALPNQKILLFKFILARLEGKAQIACSNKIFDNFDELKSFLKQNFGERKHYNHLLIDLQSCKQQQNETVAEFALRVESCLTDLQSEIYNSNSLKKDLSGRIAMTEDLALHAFTLGLHPRLGNNVRCRNPKSLNDAINIALEEEKIQNLLFKSNAKAARCKICGKSGHSESECSIKQKRIQARISYENQWPQPSSSRPNSDSNQQHIFCRYCKAKGHDISQCRKRKYNNERRQTTNSPPNHHISYEAPSSSPPPSPTPDHVSCENVGEFDCNHLN